MLQSETSPVPAGPACGLGPAGGQHLGRHAGRRGEVGDLLGTGPLQPEPLGLGDDAVGRLEPGDLQAELGEVGLGLAQVALHPVEPQLVLGDAGLEGHQTEHQREQRDDAERQHDAGSAAADPARDDLERGALLLLAPAPVPRRAGATER